MDSFCTHHQNFTYTRRNDNKCSSVWAEMLAVSGCNNKQNKTWCALLSFQWIIVKKEHFVISWQAKIKYVRASLFLTFYIFVHLHLCTSLNEIGTWNFLKLLVRGHHLEWKCSWSKYCTTAAASQHCRNMQFNDRMFLHILLPCSPLWNSVEQICLMWTALRQELKVSSGDELFCCSERRAVLTKCRSSFNQILWRPLELKMEDSLIVTAAVHLFNDSHQI